jgi:hypothetical protein
MPQHRLRRQASVMPPPIALRSRRAPANRTAIHRARLPPTDLKGAPHETHGAAVALASIAAAALAGVAHTDPNDNARQKPS